MLWRTEITNEKKIKIDPHLLTYIYKSLHRYPDNLYDITKIKQLDCDGNIPAYDFYYENVPVIIEICEGVWEIIGEMKNLKKLFIRNIELPDFSFLEKCIRLEKLVLTQTNFLDCMELRNLANLKSLTVEYMEKLLNTDVLSGLNCRIEDIGVRVPEPEMIIGPSEYKKTNWREMEGIYAGYLNYIYMQSFEEENNETNLYGSENCIHVINAADGSRPVTDEVLEELYFYIQQGRLLKLIAQRDREGEAKSALTVGISEGWASFVIECVCEEVYEEEFYFYYHNLSCPNDCEESPACPEEGMTVPKALSCNNLYEAAEIILYFIKTGELYPLANWNGYMDLV